MLFCPHDTGEMAILKENRLQGVENGGSQISVPLALRVSERKENQGSSRAAWIVRSIVGFDGGQITHLIRVHLKISAI